MSKLKAILTLALLSVLPMVNANTANTEIDQTLVFFTSLAKCTPGAYNERNPLAATVGAEWLQQQIYGLDNKGYCHVALETADGRNLDCNFSMEDLAKLNDQHFLVGIFTSNVENPSKDSVDADLLWSQMKTASCDIP